jgi:hypothetical protein
MIRKCALPERHQRQRITQQRPVSGQVCPGRRHQRRPRVAFTIQQYADPGVPHQQLVHGVTVRVNFDAESEHPVEQQRQGWQAILDKFAKHVNVCG